MATLNSGSTDARQTWVDPTVTTLDVAETAQNNGTGPDGGRPGATDQTRS